MSNRITKVNENIRKYVDEFIVKHVEVPPDLFITISRVETSRDLKHAKIFLTIIPDNKRGTGLSILKKHKNQITKFLNKSLYQKNIPSVEFLIDEKEAYGQEIDRMLDDINKSNP